MLSMKNYNDENIENNLFVNDKELIIKENAV